MLNASLPAAILFWLVGCMMYLLAIACAKLRALQLLNTLTFGVGGSHHTYIDAQCALQMEIKRYDNNNHGPCQSRQPQPLSHQRRCWINNFKHSIQFACGSVDGTKSDIDAATQTAHTHNITIKWIYMHFMHIFFSPVYFERSLLIFHFTAKQTQRRIAQHSTDLDAVKHNFTRFRQCALCDRSISTIAALPLCRTRQSHPVFSWKIAVVAWGSIVIVVVGVISSVCNLNGREQYTCDNDQTNTISRREFNVSQMNILFEGHNFSGDGNSKQ